MKILCVTERYALYFIKYKTHFAPNFPKNIHIVHRNVYKKYIQMSHTAKDTFTVPGADTTLVVLVTPLSCTKFLHTEGAALMTA